VINPQMVAPCIRFALNQLRGYLDVKSWVWPVSAERSRFEPQYCRGCFGRRHHIIGRRS
jgi:hypothetical protein